MQLVLRSGAVGERLGCVDQGMECRIGDDGQHAPRDRDTEQAESPAPPRVLLNAALVDQADLGVQEIEHRLDELRRLPLRFGHRSPSVHPLPSATERPSSPAAAHTDDDTTRLAWRAAVRCNVWILIMASLGWAKACPKCGKGILRE